MLNMSNNKTKMPEQDPQIRIHNFDESATGYTEQMAIREAMRCLKCRKHPCMTAGCPVHNHIPEFIEKITEGDFEGAYQVLSLTTGLPAVCGRVCPQYLQCEGSCVRAKKGQAVAIGALERFVADYHRKHAGAAAATPTEKNGKKVAVIGSGPAGIACAGDLAAGGFEVTIFEKEETLGGVLAYGIPAFRLPKEILASEIEGLKNKGVKFETGKEVGKDISLEELKSKEGFDAVFVCNGAGKAMALGVPGSDLEGVVSALDVLADVNVSGNLPPYKQIAIIGGGNVAMDACRAAVRFPNAEKVYVVYRRSQAEMPADPAEVAEAVAEGVEFMYLTAPLEVVGEAGKVTGLKCIKNSLSDPDESGRRRPVAIPGSEFVLPADCIIEAIGSGSDNAALGGITLSDKKGLIVVNEDLATSMDGVFAGGDTVTGPKTVIAAMGAGKKAAASIASYLIG